MNEAPPPMESATTGEVVDSHAPTTSGMLAAAVVRHMRRTYADASAHDAGGWATVTNDGLDLLEQIEVAGIEPQLSDWHQQAIALLRAKHQPYGERGLVEVRANKAAARRLLHVLDHPPEPLIVGPVGAQVDIAQVLDLPTPAPPPGRWDLET